MNVFHIEAGQNFLSTLIEGIKYRLKEFDLATITITLPSKRACAELKTHLISTDNDFPKILPLAEIGKHLLTDNSLPNYKLLTALEYKLYLTHALYKNTSINYNKALSTASELYKIITKFEKDNIDLEKIKDINFGDIPTHAQELVNNLQFIADHWTDSLRQENKASFAQAHNQSTLKVLQKWEKAPPQYPVIVAGSTGSVRTTAKLLQTIARLDNGFVVLNAIDTNLPDSSWRSINEYHPSFQLKSLIEQVGIKRNEIISWHQPTISNKTKASFLSTVMCPANHSTFWHELTPNDFRELDGIEYIECNSLQEEALVISMKIKELLDQNYQRIAIVTYEPKLIKRIKTLTKLWNITINDSYGATLSSIPQGDLIHALINAIQQNFSPITLTTLIKHPLFDLSNEESKSLIYQLEIKYLRGICKYKDLQGLIKLVECDANLVTFLEGLSNICSNIINLFSQERVIFIDTLKALLQTAETLSAQKDIWAEPFEELITASQNIGTVAVHEFQSILTAYLAEKVLYPAVEQEFKVHILNPIESRLLHFDYVILAGLNEKIWPQNISIAPWFNAAIAEELDLTKPEIQIGKSAHDFYCLMHHKEVLLTRSSVIDGKPQIASRWLTKLEVVAQKVHKLNQIKPQNHYLQKQARDFYTPKNFITYTPPEPKPQVKLRPKSLSVTQIEKLIRDPYSIYVTKILNLQKLEAIDKLPDQLEFGNFIHKVIDTFNKQYDSISPDNRLKTLIEYANKTLNHISHRPIIKRIWLPRFKKIATWLLEFEELRRENKAAKIYSEIRGSLTIFTPQCPFTLTAKADRIEMRKSNATIADFKTGALPTNTDVTTGFSPQLPLEALIAENNGFKLNLANAEELIYIQLATGSKLGNIVPIKENTKKLIHNTYEGLRKLINIYMDENTAYLICPNQTKQPAYNEFEHLERIDEFRN